jgi:type VI secretion system protein ImpE
MNAKQLYQEGRLGEAIADLTESVKSHPADQAQRIFLFELLCFQGTLDRAAKQLGVIASQSGNVGAELAVSVYEALVRGEGTRQGVFFGDALPKFLTPPSDYVSAYVMFVKKLGAAPGDAVALAEEAEALLPAFAGTRNGTAFSTFRDADDRTAGVLEIFHGEDYLWVPLDQVERIQIAKPKRLRELMWMQAQVELVGESPADVFISALYPNSNRHANDQVKLGRLTEWESLADRAVIGSGLRTFLVDDEAIALPELGDVRFARNGASGGQGGDAA